MRHPRLLFASLALLFALGGCAGPEEGQEGEGTETVEFESPEAAIPITTGSEEARQHFLMGMTAMDRGRFLEANEHFEQAVGIDPDFAYGHLMVANTGASLDEFKRSLDRAAEEADEAPQGVQLQIQIGQLGLNNDEEGQLALANQLVEAHPQSPRAHVVLANVQSGMGNEAQARATLEKATELGPEFLPAYTNLWGSYLFSEPRDFEKAEEYARKMIEIAPDEANSHEALGDALRGAGDLQGAVEAYARASELDTSDAVPVLKQGHVNSFLGRIEEATASYDAAIARARQGEKATFPNYRAFRHVHAGEPQAAIDELQNHLSAIDGMGIPADQKPGAKIFTLYNIAMIAIANDMFDVAEAALQQRADLMMQQAEKVGTPEFRAGQQAQIAYMEGLLAAKREDHETVSAKADEIASLVENLKDPQRMEPVHELRGLVALGNEKPQEALQHFQQADQDDILVRYFIAIAHEAAGNTDQATQVFEEVATNNFNSVEFALLRSTAMERAEGQEAAAMN